MENAARTAEHAARVAQRRSVLSDALPQMIPSGVPFVWEIGCGHGHFLTAYAAAHPAQLCIGVDISHDRIERGRRKRDRSKLSNLHFIHADARDFLDSLPSGVSLTHIFILFPDPWPKRRHAKNRIMQPDFLQFVASLKGQGTRLHFRTDYEPYYSDTKAMLRTHPDWEIVDEPWPFEHVTVFQSRAPNHYSLTAKPRIRAA